MAEYLFDNERVIFDFLQLSPVAKQQFGAWFLGPHLAYARSIFHKFVISTDALGQCIEMQLSLPRKLANYLTAKKSTLVWSISTDQVGSQVQITGMSVSEGEAGMLLGLKVKGEPILEDKYFSANHQASLANSKRLILTDEIVAELVNLNINQPNYVELLSLPHPYSIVVSEFHNLYEAMNEYRENRAKAKHTDAAQDVSSLEIKFREQDYKWVLKRAGLSIFYRPHNGAIIVLEKRPQLDTMVFSGGLANSYAQIGAYQAIENTGIKPNKFAGSSSGSIMALFCYLGFTAKESLNFFNELRSFGKSDTRSLKTAIDFYIIKKINQLISHDESLNNRGNFLYSQLNSGKITFASLRALKDNLSYSGFGEDLIITTTDIAHKKTQCFSYSSTPQAEVSKAVALAANFPIPFMSTVFDEDLIQEEEILSYLPLDLFKNRSTLLETEESNSLTVVAFQVENRRKPNLFSNGLREILSSIFLKSKIEHQNHQVFVFPINTQILTKADITQDLQQYLVDSGGLAATRYLEDRYQAERYSYSTFFSIEELLFFCCHRKRSDWFDFFVRHALDLGITAAKLEKIAGSTSLSNSEDESDEASLQILKENMSIFEAVFPILMKFPNLFVNDAFDLKIYKSALNAFSLDDPLAILPMLKNIKGEVHIFVQTLISLLEDFACDRSIDKQILVMLNSIEESAENLNHASFRAKWQFSAEQISKILDFLEEKRWQDLKDFCELEKVKLAPKKVGSKSKCKKSLQVEPVEIRDKNIDQRTALTLSLTGMTT